MIVMKFGGTSVQNKEAIERVISIVSGRLREKPLVVVSALAKVTRLLVQIAEEAENRNVEAYKADLVALRERHCGLCREMLSGEILEDTLSKVGQICSDLEAFVEGVGQIGELSPRSKARIISTGEILSSTIVAAAFNEKGISCNWADARRMIITDDNYLSAKPDLDICQANIKRIIPAFAKGVKVVLTQGFVSSTTAGFSSVLGFEGSDYSAAIFGMALNADRVEIWTDVDGIRTADPRVVGKTAKIGTASYEEAAVMAYLGARVLHPLTIGPARRRNIPIMVLNTMNPEGEGSSVAKDVDIPEGPKSVAFLTEIDYLEISAPVQKSVSAMLGDILPVLRANKLEISLMSTSVSKVSLTFECGQAGLQNAVAELSESYDVTYFRDKSQISVVGKNVASCPGIMDAVRESGKVSMLSFGSSMMDLSAVVDRKDVKEIVNELHNRLF